MADQVNPAALRRMLASFRTVSEAVAKSPVRLEDMRVFEVACRDVAVVAAKAIPILLAEIEALRAARDLP